METPESLRTKLEACVKKNLLDFGTEVVKIGPCNYLKVGIQSDVDYRDLLKRHFAEKYDLCAVDDCPEISVTNFFLKLGNLNAKEGKFKIMERPI